MFPKTDLGKSRVEQDTTTQKPDVRQLFCKPECSGGLLLRSFRPRGERLKVELLCCPKSCVLCRSLNSAGKRCEPRLKCKET